MESWSTRLYQHQARHHLQLPLQRQQGHVQEQRLLSICLIRRMTITFTPTVTAAVR